jgi:hypothetical protein
MMVRTRNILAAAAMLAFAAGPQVALAQQADVPFQGTVDENNACIIVVQQEGEMIATADATQMSSAFAGGTFGMADIYSWRNYFITAEPPSFFDTAPAGGLTGATFSTTFSGQDIFRGRNFAWQPGTNAVRLRGSFSITRVRVHLTAVNPSGFPAGDYTAHAIMRCE